MLQDLLATFVALGAAAHVGRRLLGVVRSSAPQAGCSSCAAGAACAPAAKPSPDVHPVVLLRRPAPPRAS
jgi:hypothetical protein